MAKKVTRPTAFTPEVLEYILDEISDGRTERSIFAKPKEGITLPTWRSWCRYKREHPEIRPHYVQAKDDCFEVWEDKIVEAAFDESRDQQPDGKGGYRSDNTAVNRDRLKVDGMKWIMSRLASKKYGDKVQQEVSGPEGAALVPILNITIAKKNG